MDGRAAFFRHGARGLRIRALLLFWLLAVFGVGCVPGPGMGEWTFPLADEYEIWHMGKESNTVYSKKDSVSTVDGRTNTPVPANVVAFAQAKDWLLVQREPDTEETPSFYLIDTAQNEVLGTYSRREDAEAMFCARVKQTDVPWRLVEDIAEPERQYLF